MFNAKNLFMERFRAHVKETVRYLQYIFNGHMAIAILFLIGAGAYYYQQALAQLPDDFPTAFIIALFFALVVIYNPIQTLLKDADLVFLLPAESQLKRYFNATLIYSYLVQLYLVIMLVAALAPLYFASYPDQSSRSYFLLGFLLVFLKAWNLLVTWWMLKIRDKNTRFIDGTLRFLLQFFIFYFYIKEFMIFSIVLSVSLFLLLYYGYYLTSKQSLAWDQLIEKDQLRMRSFYRMASMFTDVPYLKARVKKRHVCVRLFTRQLPFSQAKTYDYLYRITTVRSADYLGIYFRLAAIGGLISYYLPNNMVAVGFSLLFLYLTAIQLMTIWYHHRTVLWLDLYPISFEQRQGAFLRWVKTLLVIQTGWYGLLFALMARWDSAIFIIILGLLFTFWFTSSYLKQKTKRSA